MTLKRYIMTCYASAHIKYIKIFPGMDSLTSFICNNGSFPILPLDEKMVIINVNKTQKKKKIKRNQIRI